MQDTLLSGKESFKVEVPFKLIETGKKGKKPVIVYLHGFNENISQFEKKCEELKQLNAYHLFIQGPYPLYDKSRKVNVSDWGRAWYLYDGNRGQFIKSLELASEFIQEIIDKMLPHIDANRLAVIGYSMGGYLAAYFALTRWKHVNDLVVSGCRIKTEVLNDNFSNIQHLNILAVHGEKDESVKAEPQKREIELLKKKGINALFKITTGSHAMDSSQIETILSWLRDSGYKKMNEM
jgi:predicted esterase